MVILFIFQYVILFNNFSLYSLPKRCRQKAVGRLILDVRKPVLKPNFLRTYLQGTANEKDKWKHNIKLINFGHYVHCPM